MSLFILSSLYFFSFSLLFFFLGNLFFKKGLFLLVEWELVEINSLSIIFPMVFDYKCWFFLGTVFLISSMVILYSNSYMSEELNKSRFLLLVMLFVFSMMFLIISPSLISILLGWDGLGLTSYCLVIFYQNQSSSNSGMLTALTNRIGDVLILLSLGLMSNLGSWHFLFMYFYKSNPKLGLFFCILVCLAAFTKSAQVPFSAWLPAAMAAPTPVSSLVHSSTLVTAGVYLLIRFFKVFSIYPDLCFCMGLLGSMTMIMSGMSASVQFDMKKIIALSTLSQLGVMMTSLSLGLEELCFFHMLTHAMFKSLLFMCAGGLIHMNSDNQDARMYGDPKKLVPLTLAYFNGANLALCGMPFLSGFFSKDLILEMICLNKMNLIIFIFFFFATGITVCYSIRLMIMSFNYKFNHISPIVLLKDSHLEILLGSTVMFICSVFMGKFGFFLLLSHPSNVAVLPFYLKTLSILSCILGLLFGSVLTMLAFFKQEIEILMIKELIAHMLYMTHISSDVMKMNFFDYAYKVLKTATSSAEASTGSDSLDQFFSYFHKILSFFNKSNFLISSIYIVLFMVGVVVLFY